MRSALPWIGVVSLAVGLTLMTAEPSQAAPVSCTDAICQVSDSGWTIATDDEEQELVALAAHGVNHLYEEEFHLGFDTGIPEGGAEDISDTLVRTSATMDEDTNTIVVVYTDEECLQATVTRTLTGASDSAQLDESLALENTCSAGGSIDLYAIEYTDWDLNGSSANDTSSYDDVDTFTTTDGGATATVKTLQAPTSYDVWECCEENILYDRVSGGNLAGGSGPVGPADISHAFHFQLSLAPQATSTLSFEKTITVSGQVPEIPTLGRIGFLVLGLLLAAAALLALDRARRSARAG